MNNKNSENINELKTKLNQYKEINKANDEIISALSEIISNHKTLTTELNKACSSLDDLAMAIKNIKDDRTYKTPEIVEMLNNLLKLTSEKKY